MGGVDSHVKATVWAAIVGHNRKHRTAPDRCRSHATTTLPSRTNVSLYRQYITNQLIEHSVDWFVDEYMLSIDPVSGLIGHVIDALIVSIGLPPVIGTVIGELAKHFVEEALSPGELAVHDFDATGRLDIGSPNDPEPSVSSQFVDLRELV